MCLYSDFCDRQFGAGLAALQCSWAIWTTERSILWSGSMMLELELKPGNREFLACGLAVYKMVLVKSLPFYYDDHLHAFLW